MAHSCGASVWYSSFSGGIDTPAIIPGTAVQIAKVIEVSNSGLDATVTDRSYLDVPNCVKRNMPGMAEPGELTFTMEWEVSQDAALRALFRQWRVFQVKIPNPPGTPSGNEDAFVAFGWIKSIGTEVPADDRVTAPVTIQLDGLPFVAKFS